MREALSRWNRRVFVFSSRIRHTISDRDWSSDVCSSDLGLPEQLQHTAREGGAGPSAVAPSQVPAGSLEEIERASILKALETTRWNKQAAAALLGLRRPTLYSKMRKHGIPQSRA